MEKRKLGEILRFYRNIQQVSQEKLCKGLCSVSTISRIEQGEIDTPMLLAQALMERLGADVSKFELILDNADYHYYVQRQKVEQALRQKKITQAKLTILKYKSLQEKEFPEKNKFLQEQQAREYLIEQEQLTEQAERLLQEAGRYTIPDEEDILLSRIEIDILMTKVQKEHMENLKKVRNFVRDYYSMELREKTYPAIQMKIAKLLAEQGRLEEAVTEIAEGMAVINEGESYQYCAGDMMKRYRESLQISQESLCERICSVQTLSRLENGHQTPRRKVYQQLMERMGKGTERAYAMIFGKNLQILDDVREYEKAVYKSEYEKADELLRKLEATADDSPASRQYVLSGRAVVDCQLERILPQECRKQLLEALEITIDKPLKQDFGRYPLMDNELLILCSIADTYFWEKKVKQGIELLETILEGMRSGYRAREQYRTIEIMIVSHLVLMYGEQGNHKEALELARQGLAICREGKASLNLLYLLETMEWNMEVRRVIPRVMSGLQVEKGYFNMVSCIGAISKCSYTGIK